MRIPLQLFVRNGGSSLVIVVFLTAVAGIMVGSALVRTSTSGVLNRRASQYNGTAGAALAASEQVVAHMASDYRKGGEVAISNSIPAYRTLVPTLTGLVGNLLGGVLGLLGGGGTQPAPADSTWSKYEFTDAAKQTDRTSVFRVSEPRYTNVADGVGQLVGHAAKYRVIANAREIESPYNIISAVAQDVDVASLPLCQYQLFYVPDLELNPGDTFTVNGRIHCNKNIFLQPAGKLIIQGPTTAGGRVIYGKHPDDPVQRPQGSVAQLGPLETKVNTLNLPIGTNNTPVTLRALIERPPGSESTTSTIGKQRFYNKADLVIHVTSFQITITSGAFNSFATSIPNYGNFISKKLQKIYNKRECKDVLFTELDMTQLKAHDNQIASRIGRSPKIIYIADLRAHDSDEQAGIRIVNADTLPSYGLTIATPNPLYIRGDFNVGNAPACLAADAITLLSGAWEDENASRSISSRVASSTTLNAALITGIVPTQPGSYSGGAENALRLLEDWSGRTLAFNGAMAVLYYSEEADAPWGGPDVYAPPQRSWSFNASFLTPSGQPAGTPELRAMFRSGWASVRPHSTF